MNVIEQIEKAEQERLLSGDKTIPDFSAGDTLVIQVRITEGTRTRPVSYTHLTLPTKA